jgi:glycosyltransferase involved in cell wall biosynthesis
LPFSKNYMPLSTLQIDDRIAWGGGQSQVLHLLKGLNDASHHAELVTRPGSVLGKRAGEIGVTVHTIPMRGEADLFSAWKIARIVRSGDFDIVHMHAAHAHTLGALACALNSSPKCVVSRRVVFPIKTGPLGLATIKYRYRINAYIAVCGAAKEALVSAGVDPRMIHVVHSGVVPPCAIEGKDVRAEFGIAPRQRLVGTVGELVEAKGQRHLIAAVPLILKKRPETKFMIVGGGRLETELKNRVSRLGVADSFVFAGFRDDVGNCLEAFDMFVLPSDMEGLNNSIVEAMMMGKPVAASNVGGIPEIVKHGETGLLFAPGKPTLLAEAVLDLLNNPEKASALASAGREYAMGHLTADKMIESTISVYRNLLGK